MSGMNVPFASVTPAHKHHTKIHPDSGPLLPHEPAGRNWPVPGIYYQAGNTTVFVAVESDHVVAKAAD